MPVTRTAKKTSADAPAPNADTAALSRAVEGHAGRMPLEDVGTLAARLLSMRHCNLAALDTFLDGLSAGDARWLYDTLGERLGDAADHG